jgi:hypothetical protein
MITASRFSSGITGYPREVYASGPITSRSGTMLLFSGPVTMLREQRCRHGGAEQRRPAFDDHYSPLVQAGEYRQPAEAGTREIDSGARIFFARRLAF